MSAGDLADRVHDTLRDSCGVAAGDPLVVGFSGGADSTALALLLSELGHPLRLVLVDHGNRPLGGERRQIETLAGMLGCAFEIRSVVVAEEASWEAAARRSRYAALLEAAEGDRPCAVATGHTADDQAETVLLRILRGSGLRGLRAIHYRREDAVVRPLLDVRRTDLRAYLDRRGVTWCDDPTNEEPRFLRNRLRREVMPALEGFSATAISQLAHLAQAAADELELLERLLAPTLDVDPTAGIDLTTLPSPIGAALVRRLLERHAPHSAVTRRQIEALVRLCSSFDGERELHLPEGITTRRVYDRLYFFDNPDRRNSSSAPQHGASREKTQTLSNSLRDTSSSQEITAISGKWPANHRTTTRHTETQMAIDGPCLVHLPSGALEISIGPPELPLSDRRCVAFSIQNVNFPLFIETAPLDGHFRPFGCPYTRKIKDLLTEAKIPRSDRALATLLSCRGRPLWLIGIRRSSEAPIGDDGPFLVARFTPSDAPIFTDPK
ncbi:MAG: tRNA lysidine(34) synthetase TilS [Myxococcales bacterium]|nr:tRNA lysidine(34) synthetase TilS [Myxococcales bacterium]